MLLATGNDDGRRNKNSDNEEQPDNDDFPADDLANENSPSRRSNSTRSKPVPPNNVRCSSGSESLKGKPENLSLRMDRQDRFLRVWADRMVRFTIGSW